ncbi:MAG: hypothetical protein AXW13_08465 [Alcanivorax sp. Nap_24]|nr:MAG: hypothetical protein AXW13_08465 [Alcanivorax sp. Nap_24]
MRPVLAGGLYGRSGLVETLTGELLALELLQVTLYSGGTLALTLLGGLLVVLATTDFGEHTGFLAGTLETTQGHVEGFAFFHFHLRHEVSPTLKLD